MSKCKGKYFFFQTEKCNECPEITECIDQSLFKESLKMIVKKPCLGNLKLDCPGDCSLYKECLDIYMQREIKASEHRRDD